MKNKILKRHIKGCPALDHYLDGTWSNPWSPCTEKYIWRDTLCRRNRGRYGSQVWLVFRCNTIKCDAELAVYAEDVLNIAQNN
jgi:hypothetical protein